MIIGESWPKLTRCFLLSLVFVAVKDMASYLGYCLPLPAVVGEDSDSEIGI